MDGNSFATCAAAKLSNVALGLTVGHLLLIGLVAQESLTRVPANGPRTLPKKQKQPLAADFRRSRLSHHAIHGPHGRSPAGKTNIMRTQVLAKPQPQLTVPRPVRSTRYCGACTGRSAWCAGVTAGVTVWSCRCIRIFH